MKLALGINFFVRRWRGEVCTSTLLWWDMLLVGTAINVAATFAALILVALGFPPALGVVVHFVPLPYNLFLFAAIWRSPQRTSMPLLIAFIWLMLATLV